MFAVSIGIPAYNEEFILPLLLRSLQHQEISSCSVDEIVVVASGCTDRTEAVVREYMQGDDRIRLVSEEKRRGKASAVNLFLATAKGDIVVLVSADVIPDADAVERLISPFSDPSVGMTGARPIPANPKNSFVGYAVNLMWALHHRIALSSPKLGEMVAFRSIVKEIPEDTAVDEAAIEALITGSGYSLCYVPEAVVRNRGPETVSDFLKQRRRIAAGHLHLAKRMQYRISTGSPFRIARLLFRDQPRTIREIIWTLGAVGMEALGRLLGWYDVCIKRKNPYIWDIACSTKHWM